MTRWILGRQFRAMCVWPFILAKPGDELSKYPAAFNHERIHARQQLEMLWLIFFIWYGIEFLMRLAQYRKRREAYLGISFEKEAFAHENETEYLHKRKSYTWLKYL